MDTAKYQQILNARVARRLGQAIIEAESALVRAEIAEEELVGIKNTKNAPKVPKRGQS